VLRIASYPNPPSSLQLIHDDIFGSQNMEIKRAEINTVGDGNDIEGHY
jgi:hypothetical protein